MKGEESRIEIARLCELYGIKRESRSLLEGSTIAGDSPGADREAVESRVVWECSPKGWYLAPKTKYIGRSIVDK